MKVFEPLVSLVLMSGAGLAVAATPVMREADVVFMYSGGKEAHERYGATWVAWGGGPQEGGIHSTGSFWCLTAGARLLHTDPKLRDAVAKDIEGNPIKVPWQLDHVHEGTPTWFGCTNNPDFKNHLRDECRRAVKGDPDGIHIDDPSGTYAPVSYGGGCFCDHCMRAFREYLKANETPELLAEAEVESFVDFDYRELVRKRAKTLEEYRKVQDGLPLRSEFVECQLNLAVQNIRSLGVFARGYLGPAMTLSVNTYYSGPGNHFLAFVPSLTHMVAEVKHAAAEGTARLNETIVAYRQAETVGKPLAATAGGEDWAYVKERGSVNLVKVWIALSYACGQRLMVPHPKQQWCHTKEKGTHWYAAPMDEFAPLYRFVRKNAGLFNGFRSAGPMAPPEGGPFAIATAAGRRKLKEALERGDVSPLTAGDSIWVFPRLNDSGRLVVHLVNVGYDGGADRVRVERNVTVRIPAGIVKVRGSSALVRAYDAETARVSVDGAGDGLSVTVPEVGIWTVLEF